MLKNLFKWLGDPHMGLGHPMNFGENRIHGSSYKSLYERIKPPKPQHQCCTTHHSLWISKEHLSQKPLAWPSSTRITITQAYRTIPRSDGY